MVEAHGGGLGQAAVRALRRSRRFEKGGVTRTLSLRSRRTTRNTTLQSLPRSETSRQDSVRSRASGGEVWAACSGPKRLSCLLPTLS